MRHKNVIFCALSCTWHSEYIEAKILRVKLINKPSVGNNFKIIGRKNFKAICVLHFRGATCFDMRRSWLVVPHKCIWGDLFVRTLECLKWAIEFYEYVRRKLNHMCSFFRYNESRYYVIQYMRLGDIRSRIQTPSPYNMSG